MKRLVFLLFCVPLFAGCAAKKLPISATVDKSEFTSRVWNVAVLDLDYTPIESGFSGLAKVSSAGNDAGQIIATLLASELARLENIKVVERGRIKDLITEQHMQMSGAISTSTAVEIGQLVGADAVVLGNVNDYVNWTSIGLLGTTVSFSMRMIDVQSGTVITSGSASTIENYSIPFQHAQNLTRQFVDELESSLNR